MTTRLLSLILSVIIFIASTSCTTNDGDIGSLMGQWKLTAIDIDGIAEPGYNGDIFWQFQSHVISMRRTDAHHDQSACYGSWTMPSANTLDLDFTHTDDKSPDEDFRYTPFEETMLPRAISCLNIITLNSSHFKATYTTSDGRIVTYNLIKW